VPDVARHHVESRGHRIEYLAWGDGPPLVLVSGTLQAAEDWVAAGYADALQDFRVLAVDPLGFGASDKPHDPAAYHLDGRAIDLDAILDAQGIATATLWGYSSGAVQVEAYARLRPERTRALVVGGMVPALNATDRRNVGMAGIATYESGDWATVWRDAMPFVPVELHAQWEQRNDLAAVAASARGSWEAHGAEGGALPTPLLCYVGSEEWFYEFARASVAVPGATFAAIEGADHVGAFRDVATVTGLVRSFLRDNT
jgi:pimeloyl-ACP methyl ester carboxylesterase